MEVLKYDIIEVLVNECHKESVLCFGLYCSCKYLYEYACHKLLMKKSILEAIRNDDIETVAYNIYNGFNVNDCIKLCLLNGSIVSSRWIWKNCTPQLTLRTLKDLENNMTLLHGHESLDFICWLIRKIQCAHEAANNHLITNMNIITLSPK